MPSERTARRHAPPFINPSGYVRRRPETTVMYQQVERLYPQQTAAREVTGQPLPKYM
jgi:hypothetical protein